MGTEISAEKKTFSVTLNEKLDSVFEALPSGFNKVRFTQNALSVLNEKPELVKDFGQAQVMAGLIKGAILGLDFSNKECYLVGYGKTLNYQTSYIGAQKLIKKYSLRKVKDIYSEIVREGDDLDVKIVDNHKSVNFNPKVFSNAPIVGAFAVVVYDDGDVQVETMSLEALENTRKKSKMANSGAWKDFTSEMYKKTVIRRLCKHIEIDFENIEQKNLFEADTDIETDDKELRNKEVQENANSEEFTIEGSFTEVQ